MKIGRYGYYPGWVFQGAIDTVAIWNRALSSNEVVQVYATAALETAADVQVSKQAVSRYSLLLHAEGTEGSTTVTDECGHACAALNGAHITANDRYFGNASLLLDGSDDYVEIPDSSDFEPGSQPFTIDFWMKPRDLSGHYIIGKSNPDSGLGYDIRLNAGCIDVCGVNGWGFNIISPSIVTTSRWQHVAVCGTTTNVLLFIDGVLSGSCGRQNIAPTPGRHLRLGYTANFGGTHYNGYLDEVRFLLGEAHWTSNFDPPTLPYALDRVDAGELSVIHI